MTFGHDRYFIPHVTKTRHLSVNDRLLRATLNPHRSVSTKTAEIVTESLNTKIEIAS